MKPEDVPDEWMQTADAVLVPGKPLNTNDLRRALAAVALLIAAAERKACARVALKIAHLHDQSDPRHATGWAIHDAIRARGEGEG